ncbi:MAG TPA: hypothetical protein PLD18_00800 [Flavobacterium sp.]|nr:hypothetical protein [Flavobacterium sp.]HRA73905.1 hypothetical protein [Flavobacterium sp.]
MKNEGFEISIKQLKVILSIGTIILAFFLVYKFVFMSSREQLLDGSLRKIREENFQGFVIDKNYDKNNHNSPMIYLRNKTKIAVFGEFWSQIKIGDSLEKKKGETIITVYRNNMKFTLDNKDIINSLNN